MVSSIKAENVDSLLSYETKKRIQSLNTNPGPLGFICLLESAGKHTSRVTNPSKGKRAQRRKRKEALEGKAVRATINQKASHQESKEVLEHLTIGFNATNRHLESLAQKSIPRNVVEKDALPGAGVSSISPRLPHETKSMAAVFVPYFDRPSVLYSHLPLLIKTASLTLPCSSAIRLMMLPKGTEERLAVALSIPRIGLIGLLEGAPRVDTLIDIVRKKVSDVDIPWIAEGGAHYKPVNIKASQTKALGKRKKDNA
ncbi:RNase P and RNase MRP subunit [Lecanora helva]